MLRVGYLPDRLPYAFRSASGDIVGLFHGGDPSGAGQTRNTVFGRLAGEHAAALTA